MIAERKRGCDVLLARPRGSRRIGRIVALVVLAAGCGPVVPGGGGSDNGGNGNGGGGDGGARPVVSLSASSVTPQVGEEVELSCRVTNGADVETFSFQPSLGRLVVDGDAGRATFIVDAVDVGVSLSFTCAGRNENGLGANSNAVTITATQAPE